MLLDTAEYQNAVEAAKQALQIVKKHDIARLISDIERVEMLGPVIAPEKWRDNHEQYMRDRDLLTAALSLWDLAMELEGADREIRLAPCYAKQSSHAPPCILYEGHKGSHEDRNGRAWR
jgi:hypothetical protein